MYLQETITVQNDWHKNRLELRIEIQSDDADYVYRMLEREEAERLRDHLTQMLEKPVECFHIRCKQEASFLLDGKNFCTGHYNLLQEGHKISDPLLDFLE
jgi:hypothetical protein